jgi:membrane-associated phospholipid phosphatase
MSYRGVRGHGATRWQVAVAGLLAAAMVATACGSDDDAKVVASAEPSAGSWRTWVLSSPTDIPVPPPPDKDSDQAKAEERELRDFVARRTPEVADFVGKWEGVGEPVSAPWMEMALEFISARAKDPPASSRAYALLSVAAYDAMVATWHYKYQYKREAPDVVDYLSEPGPDPSYPSEHAAIAGAASKVLAYLFPERPALRLDEAAEQAAESRVFAGANYRSDVTAGLDLGRAVGDRVVEFARQDGAEKPCTKRAPGGAPRYWAPQPGSVANPVQPCAGEWKTWVMAAGNQFRPGPPPVIGSAEFTAQARELVDIKNNLTQDQKRAATFWAGGDGTPLPAGVWNQVTLAYLRDRKPTEPQAERAMALANVAMADAGVASWDTKFAYWDPRPVNGIRDSGVDRTWEPFLGSTPFFPAYISGHATYSGAIAEVLSWIFPDNEADFRAKAQEASDARLWGGIHWRADSTVGLDVGKKVGMLVIERAKSDGAPPPNGRKA